MYIWAVYKVGIEFFFFDSVLLKYTCTCISTIVTYFFWCKCHRITKDTVQAEHELPVSSYTCRAMVYLTLFTPLKLSSFIYLFIYLYIYFLKHALDTEISFYFQSIPF